MKVWIVYVSFGEYDMYRTQILKVFDTEQKAISFKDTYENNPLIDKAKDLYDKWLNSDMRYDENGVGSVRFSDEEMELIENDDLIEFNSCYIEEFEVE
jgi:hypothetical protein